MYLIRKCSNCHYKDCDMDHDPCEHCNDHSHWSPQSKSPRPSHTDYYLDIARAVSRRSTCLRRQYGAVIVNNDEIIATGYNGAPRGRENCCDIGKCNREHCEHNDGNYGNCRSVHAEMNCIISASRAEMIGSTIYLAGFENGQAIAAEPCPICMRLIINAGIARIVTDGSDFTP